MQTNTVFTATNRRTLRQAVITANATLDILRNPQTGKVFFTLGQTTGYVSPNALAAIEGGTATLDNLQVADVSRDGGNPVPTLMVVGSGAPVLKSFGAELLH